MIALLLQVFIFVSQPVNETPIEVFSNPLIEKTTPLIIEEYLQEYGWDDVRLTKDIKQADVVVYPYFIYYDRPNTETSFVILKGLKEKVGLEMRLEFEHPSYSFIQILQATGYIEKEAKSNFLSIEEGEGDFGDMVVFNLIKKTLDECFKDYRLLIF